MSVAQRCLHSFPTRRSSDLRGCAGSPFVTSAAPVRAASMQEIKEQPTTASEATDGLAAAALRAEAWAGEPFLREGEDPAQVLDRKSTRLNSSHVAISYAVFC